MAEILLSLTIIGVVAAITLPSLTGNINERTWNTQRKALYARFSQAITLMPALNGYGTLTEDENHSVTADTAAESFVTEGLSKVLKINNICDAEHLQDCGIPKDIIRANGSKISDFTSTMNTLVSLNYMFNGSNPNRTETNYEWYQTDTKAAAFETVNGESIMVYYNPRCVGYMQDKLPYYVQGKICANFIYDLNGNKGPNTVGKDIGFMTALYPTDTVLVAPVVLNSNNISTKPYREAIKYCNTFNNNSRLINSDELASVFVNQLLLWNDIRSDSFISSTRAQDTQNYYMYMRIYAGQINQWPIASGSENALCVSR